VFERIDFKTGTFYLGDCFEVLAALPAGNVDMILNDPPYGTTQNKWDSVLPLPDMWAAYWRVLKANGPAVMTAAQPFTSALVMSQVERFKYGCTWDKKNPTGFLNAKKQPLRVTEDVCVFAAAQTTYNPLMEVRGKPRKKGGYNKPGGSENYGSFEDVQSFSNEYYPTNLISISNADRLGKFHPTQKPVALFEYLIRTYTNPGELVLDPTAGSGTTAVAAINSGRRWICVERDPEYFFKACARVYDAEQG